MRRSHRIAVALALTGLAAMPGGSPISLRGTARDSAFHCAAGEAPATSRADRADTALDRSVIASRAVGRAAASRRAAEPAPKAVAHRRHAPADHPTTEAMRRVAVPAPSLDRTAVAAGTTTARLRGADPRAPGPVVLWRTDGDRFAPLARGESTANGRFDFGQLAVPARGLDVVVTRPGERPAAAPPGSRLHLEPSEIPPPFARADRAGAAADWTLELTPVRLDGALVVEDASGRVRAEIDLAALAPPLRRRVRVALPPDVGPWVQVAHALPDGRRSAHLVVPLPPGVD